MTQQEFINIENSFQVGAVKLEVDLAEPEQQKFYTCSEGNALKFWTPTEKENWKGGEIASSNFRGDFAVFKDYFVGETKTDVITGIEEHVVLRYDQDGVAFDPLTKFNDPVSVVAVSPNGQLLAAGSTDFVFKILRMADDECETYDRKDLDGAPLSASFDPSNQWLAVAASDGYTAIYDLANKTADPLTMVKWGTPFNVVTPKSPRNRPIWHPNGSSLFVPTNNGIEVVSTTDWTIERTIAKGTNISHVAVSPSGRHLAAVSNADGIILIFHLGGYMLLSTTKIPENSSKHVFDILFSPIDGETLILGIENNFLIMLKNACQLQVNDALPDEEPMDEDVIEDKKRNLRSNGPLFDDDEDDDMDIIKIKSEYGYDKTAEARTAGPRLTAEQLEALNKLKQPLIPITALQPPETFVSGSTPIESNKIGGKERFLQWNAFGQIRQMWSDNGAASTEIEFNDITVHSEIIHNDDKYSLADMNNNIIALASSDELYVYVVGCDTESREWRIKVPENERIECVSVGKTFIAIYTNERIVRIFSPCGVQRSVFSVDGPLITMTARDSVLALAYATGAIFAFSSNSFESATHLDVFQVNPLGGSPFVLQKLRSTPVAMSPEASLSWLSVSSAGHIVAMDSDFVVRILAQSGVWMPIYQGAKVLKNENGGFWPIAVLDNGIHLLLPKMRYVISRGTRFPMVSRQLIPATMPWDVPIVQKCEKTTNEEHKLIVSEVLLAVQQGTVDRKLLVQHLSALLTLFSTAIKSDQIGLAGEYAEITHCIEGVNAMARVASKQEKRGINERITKIGESKPESYRINCKPPNASLYASVESVNVPRANPASQRRPQLAPTSTLAPLTSLAPPALLKPAPKAVPVPKTKVHEIPESQDLFDDSTMSQISDVSFDLNLSLPNSSAGPSSFSNPFKRAAPSNTTASTSSSGDFFADLGIGTTSNKPSTASGQPAKKPKVQQSKLSFGVENRAPVATQNEKKKLTAFDAWLQENMDTLTFDFDGDSTDKKAFDEYTVKMFRLTDKDEKKKYREIAESHNTNMTA